MGRATRRTPSRKPRSSEVLTRAGEWLKSGMIGFAMFMVIRTFLFQTFTIISGSMESTLMVGDFLMVSKAAYGATVPGTSVRIPGYTEPEIGDVAVFEGPAEPIDIVKRIVGLPGDTVSMQDGVLVRNGASVSEAYVERRDPTGDVFHSEMYWQTQHAFEQVPRHRPSRDNWGPLVVPAGAYFVLGDNRDRSRDSRYWGLVPRDNLKGRATFIYFSWSQWSNSPVPVIGRIRWQRIGDSIR